MHAQDVNQSQSQPRFLLEVGGTGSSDHRRGKVHRQIDVSLCFARRSVDAFAISAMAGTFNRRKFLQTAGGLAIASCLRPERAQSILPVFSYPMGLPGKALGDGFYLRHGFTCENLTNYPGWWHTGEDSTGNGDADSHFKRRRTHEIRRRLTALTDAGDMRKGSIDVPFHIPPRW
jgi:hypothetical protein